MAFRVSVARVLSAPDEWDRRKLQVLLGAALAVSISLVAGVLWSVVTLLRVGGPSGAAETDVGEPPALMDVRAMQEAAEPGALATTGAGTIDLPAATSLGRTQVATGFPRTAEGALAQLAAIDQRAIQSASVVTAQGVIAAWAAPGGPTPESWSGVAAVRALLESAGLPASGLTDLVVELQPAMGFIRASGSSSVTGCIDFVLVVNLPGEPPNRIAAADCQVMQWRVNRWLIAPGPEAEPAPSLWPGSQASLDAGYLWIEVGP